MSSKAKADNKAPAPKAASKPMMTEGILNKRPTSEPSVKEQAAIAPEKKRPNDYSTHKYYPPS